MEVELPWPPSINHYYLHVGNRVVLGERGRNYRRRVEQALIETAGKWPRIHGDVYVRLELYPPDRRRRDIDNIRKAVYDVISDRPGHIGFIVDDSQIKRDEAMFTGCISSDGGMVKVHIRELTVTNTN